MKAQEIFNRAIKLMDEQSESGSAMWSDTAEYQNRAVEILNTLINECYPFSDTYKVETPGKRPVCLPILLLEDEVNLDDGMAGTVLPYGLAAELIKNDDPALGNYFLQRYNELLARFSRTLPAEWDTPEDFYGGLQHTQFAGW